MLQLIESIMSDPADKTHVTLLFANKTDADIIARSYLDELAAAHPKQLKVVYTVENKKGNDDPLAVRVGRVTKTMVRAYMPGPDEPGTKVLVCGKGPMVAELAGPKVFQKGKAPQQGPLLGVLKELGYSEAGVLKV